MAIIAYIDEAGTTSYKVKKGTWFVCAAVLIAEENYDAIERDIAELDALLPLGAAGATSSNRGYFHARELFRGTGRFAGWTEERRQEALLKHAEIIRKYQIPLILGSVDKTAVAAKYAVPYNPNVMSFAQCGRGIELYMTGEAPSSKWMAMIGRSDSREKLLIAHYQECLVKSPYGYGTEMKWSHALDFPTFIKAQASYFFRLADLVAFAVSGKKHGKRGWGLYEVISPYIGYDHPFQPKG